MPFLFLKDKWDSEMKKMSKKGRNFLQKTPF